MLHRFLQEKRLLKWPCQRLDICSEKRKTQQKSVQICFCYFCCFLFVCLFARIHSTLEQKSSIYECNFKDTMAFCKYMKKWLRNISVQKKWFLDNWKRHSINAYFNLHSTSESTVTSCQFTLENVFKSYLKRKSFHSFSHSTVFRKKIIFPSN